MTLDDVLVEIAELEDNLDRLRTAAAHPWNPQQAEKLAQQIDACERHLTRLRSLR